MDNRVLGAIAMICAPAMLGFLLGGGERPDHRHREYGLHGRVDLLEHRHAADAGYRDRNVGPDGAADPARRPRAGLRLRFYRGERPPVIY